MTTTEDRDPCVPRGVYDEREKFQRLAALGAAFLTAEQLERLRNEHESNGGCYGDNGCCLFYLLNDPEIWDNFRRSIEWYKYGQWTPRDYTDSAVTGTHTDDRNAHR